MVKKKKYYGGGMTPKMYANGGNVDPFSLKNPEGAPVKKAKEMLESMPTTNAQERSQKMAMGGKIPSAHKKHHSKKHIKVMKEDMQEGDSFKKAHNKALKKVGK